MQQTNEQPAAEKTYYACCDACHSSLSEARYLELEAAAASDRADPRCPACGRSVWSFHEL